jgi:HEAT repeat protein
MCLVESATNSADSTSWRAHREAEKLSDPDMLDEVLEYLSKKRSKGERKAAYFILGKIGKNIESTKASHALLQHVLLEKDKYALSSALDLIADLPLREDEDISPITNFLSDTRWPVRHSAIQALRSASSPEAESRLINLLENTKDDFDKIYCHSTLSFIGTEQSIPALQANIQSRKRDVKASAINALENIQQRVMARKNN